MKVIKAGKWNEKWAGKEATCPNPKCEAVVVVEEEDLDSVGYDGRGYSAKCCVCYTPIFFKASELNLPEWLVRKLKREPVYNDL